jgi:hypothetical protein
MNIEEYDQQFSHGKNLLAEIRKGSIERLRRAGDLYQEQLNDWEDLAKTEESVRREYEGRYLFELIQNADDVLVEWLEKQDQKDHVNGHRRIRIQLTPESLIVANDGLPFLEDNIRALCRIHKTTKSASKQIGHKGIGFKSVLKISQTPQIFSGDFAFIFDNTRFTKAVKDILGDKYSGQLLPILRTPFDSQIQDLPACDQKIIQEIFDDGYVTIIRLPFFSLETFSVIRDQIESDVTANLLLFLNAINEIEVNVSSHDEFVLTKELLRKDNLSSEIGLYRTKKGSHKEFLNRWLLIASDPIPIQDQELVEGLGDAWQELRFLRGSIAFSLLADGSELEITDKSQKFNVYFPTNEYSGFGFLVNADFYLEAARKDIRLNELNRYLADQIVNVLKTKVIRVLCNMFPNSSQIVDALAPVRTEPEREFSSYFYKKCLSELQGVQFVPVGNDEYAAPENIRFTPFGADPSDFRDLFYNPIFLSSSSVFLPIIRVEDSEKMRSKRGVKFLEHEKMGARRINFEELPDLLTSELLIDLPDKQKFIQLLADWWSELKYWKAKDFIKIISDLPIIPLRSGWISPTEGLIFQANLREISKIEIPEGFNFQIIPIQIYGEKPSVNSNIHKFLGALGVNDYSSAAIIREAILPKITNRDEFSDLMKDFPNAIFRAYEFIIYYLEQDLSIRSFEEKLKVVPVPIRKGKETEEVEWKPASEVYFSSFWLENDDLEVIFGGFNDVCFLIDDLSPIGVKKGITKESLKNLFLTLGVHNFPVIFEWYENSSARGLKYSSKLKNCIYTEQYINEIHDLFYCTNEKKDHGYSRRMVSNATIDHLDQILDEINVEKSKVLLRLLSSNWSYYKKELYKPVRCKYKTTGCSSGRAPTYFWFCLTTLAWLPASRLGEISKELFSSKAIWNLDLSTPKIVRDLLPTFPDDIRQYLNRDFLFDLLRHEYAIEDFISLLNDLPNLYPLPSESENVATFQELFLWVCKIIQSELKKKGRENWPEKPESIRVMSKGVNGFNYAAADDPSLVINDDPLLADVWQEELKFVIFDRDWNELQEWLGISGISDVITVEITELELLPEDGNIHIVKISEVFPFLLAIIHNDNPSGYRSTLRRLSRLQIHAVKKLTVSQEFLPGGFPNKLQNSKAHLVVHEDVEGSITTFFGDLYVNLFQSDIHYSIGKQIASYLGVGKIADIFTFLFVLDNPEKRLSYLNSKGIGKEIVEKVSLEYDQALQGNVKRDFIPQNLSIDSLLSKREMQEKHENDFMEKPDDDSRREPGSATFSDLGHGRSGQNESNSKEPQKVEGRQSERAEFGQHSPFGAKRTASGLTGKRLSYVNRSGGEPSRTDDEQEKQKQEHRELVDRKGVQRVIAFERKHGRKAREMPHHQKGYDIESMEDGQKRYIEVKSIGSAWGGRNAPGLSSSQYQMAVQKGENYWLYVVEFALSDEESKVYPIPDPANTIDEYIYDQKWKEFAKPD